MTCTRCGRELVESEAVWLERNWMDNTYKMIQPPEYSQGGFPFGADCAKIVLSCNGVCIYKGEHK